MTLLPIHVDRYTPSWGQEGFENHPAPSSLTMNSGWTTLSHFTITCHAFSKSSILSSSMILRAFLNDWSLHVPSFVNSFYFFVDLHGVQSISFTCHALANSHPCIVMSVSMTGRRFEQLLDIAGQQFQWLCLKVGASMLTVCDHSCNICQKIWEWLDEDIVHLWRKKRSMCPIIQTLPK